MKRMQKWMGDAACALGLLVAGCASDGNSRSTGQVIDDTAILTKTKAALINDPVVAGTSINVDVSRGVVSLNGAVNGFTGKQKAGEIARGVEGVRAVRNNLVVRDAVGSAPGVKVKSEAEVKGDKKVDVDGDRDPSIKTEVKIDK